MDMVKVPAASLATKLNIMASVKQCNNKNISVVFLPYFQWQTHVNADAHTHTWVASREVDEENSKTENSERIGHV